MTYFFYILIAILMFGILIAVHELGHFLAAKSTGVRVNEFAIGMGPKLLSFGRGETQYTLRLLPIGGFCAMEGEDDESDDPRSFHAAAGWKRFLILIAGSVMNFLTGLVILILLFAPAKTTNTPVVSTVTAGGPAVGVLQEGDRIVSVNGHRILLWDNIAQFVNTAKGAPVTVEVERGGETHRFTIRPVTNEKNLWVIGMEMTEISTTFFTNLQESLLRSVDFVRMVFFGLGELLGGRAGLSDLSGPIGIVTAVGDMGVQSETVGDGLFRVLLFMSLIAVNLAVMNLLPIPALDGGQILFLFLDGIYNKLTRRRLSQKIAGYINAAGLVCLLGLMAVVAISDVWKRF